VSFVKTHLPCPDTVNCGSTDAYALNEDGSGKCYSCNKFFKRKNNQQLSVIHTNQEYPDISTAPAEASKYTKEFLPWRGISAETFRAYGVHTYVAEDGLPHHLSFVYPGGGTKNRALAQKEFWSQGQMSAPGLFGQQKFPPGSARAITITEGELDALSVFQMLGSQYPSVSIRSSGSAGKDCGKVFDYLNSFEKIYLCLDTDEVGRKAAREIASLFDFNKVFEVKLGDLKDANEYLKAGKEKEFRNVWFNSKRYLPEGIVSSLSEFRSILEEEKDKPSIEGPFSSIDALTMGIRTGEFILVTAPEGIGKTEFIRRFEHHLLRNTDVPIGCIHLEETKARQLKGLAGLELGVPAHLPTTAVSPEEIHGALKNLTDGRDDRLHIYSHFGSDDPDVLLEAIRFLVAVCGCRYVFLDHITMVVTGLESDDERKTLDYLSTKLATMVHDMDFTLFCISHVNDDGKTRGSRNISKVANIRIDLSRDLVAELEEERNKTFVTVSKNRFAGKTGPAGVLAFDVDEFMLKEADQVVHLPPV
jgi:twinkle protein